MLSGRKLRDVLLDSFQEIDFVLYCTVLGVNRWRHLG